ncbi:50S ribosomal protein L13 [Candidatus Dojkabacteria bacterium]|nr:50S ribosomal protein L13 [Candidatus Dojkabacteria bacterium]
MRTSWLREKEIKRKWYLVDIAGQTLGRAATQIASLLIGKSKVNRVPNMDCGDYVIVINCSELEVSGKKMTDKMYYRHSGYPDGFRERTLEEMMKKNPCEVVELAVKNMLPNNKLRASMFTRLFTYAGSDHKHSAQKPEVYELEK